MNLRKIYIATIIATLPTTGVFAAALERSNQSIQAFLEPGNYIEAGFNVTDQNIKGKTTSNTVGNVNNTGRNIDFGKAIDDTYLVPNAALKIQATDHFSVGLIYDKPFGIDTKYTTGRPYFATSTTPTSVKLDTQNLTLLFGYQPNENWNVYVGPVYQQFEGGHLTLFGQHAQQSTTVIRNYNAVLNKDESFGWLTGIAYTNNEYGLKSSLTYRSEIKHKFKSDELISETNQAQLLTEALKKDSILKTPQSINFDINKTINSKTSASMSIRWVDWSNFELYLPYYNVRSQTSATPTIPPNSFVRAGGYNPIAYKKDQWAVDLGLEHKLTEKWKLSGALGWDSGVGKYISHYTPISSSWSAGVGVQFSPASNYFIETGFKYIWLDNVKGQHAAQFDTHNYDTEFNDNHALSYDFKIGYRF